ncbi:hypothetical protein F164LOC_05975 [Pectobacterium carotovorum]|nr:hypothetical protein F164LOC_05975 [Pectobacterium carotovorum]
MVLAEMGLKGLSLANRDTQGNYTASEYGNVFCLSGGILLNQSTQHMIAIKHFPRIQIISATLGLDGLGVKNGG